MTKCLTITLALLAVALAPATASASTCTVNMTNGGGVWRGHVSNVPCRTANTAARSIVMRHKLGGHHCAHRFSMATLRDHYTCGRVQATGNWEAL
jgi:hypothetical protein